MNISKPAMLVYSFAPKENLSNPELCQNARDYLRHLWDTCTIFGIKDRSERLGLPVEFPEERNLYDSGYRVTAAKIHAQRLASKSYYQAFIFQYQEILGFIATFETNESPGEWSRWRRLYDKWTMTARDDFSREGLMGEAYVFSGVCEDESLFPARADLSGEQLRREIARQVGRPAMSALPCNNNADRRANNLYLTGNGFCLWEGESSDDRRMIALIAPESKADAAFRWSVWPDGDQLAPLARYLMYAFKLRNAQRVFEQEISGLRRGRHPIDPALKDFIELHKHIENNRRLAGDELQNAQEKLSRAQRDYYRLYYSVSRLKDLRLTVQIGKKNLQQLIPEHHPAQPSTGDSLFDADVARAEWLEEQIAADLGYLDVMVMRAEEGYKVIAQLLDYEKQKNAQQLNSLILLQGSLLGALVVGLTAIQAFQPITIPNKAPLILLLAALALALPPLFAHWHEPYRKADRLIGGVLGASVLFYVLTLWAVLPLPAYRVKDLGWVLYRVIGLILGFILGYIGTDLLDRMKATARKPEEKMSAEGE